VFRFAAIADVQYADVDDCYNFSKTQIRKYRGALDVLKRAVADWLDGPEVAFVANLGDAIDQQNQKLGQSDVALDKVLAEFDRLAAPKIHALGNHEYYNFTKKELAERLGPAFHSVTPVDGWRMILLDSYDFNCIDSREMDESKDRAFTFLEKYNANELRVRGTSNWTAGLKGYDKRFVPFNGGIGEEQLQWLDKELKDADSLGQRVIIFAHVPVAPNSCSLSCLTWNFEDVLRVIDGHSSVVAFMAGHDHSGGYTRRHGVHYLTLPSPLNVENQDDQCAHALIDVHVDKLVLHGRGLVDRKICGSRGSRDLYFADASSARSAEPGSKL